jgi:transcriptional regulator with XRE-family HTH domain
MTTPTITLGMRLAIARRSAGLSAKDVARSLRVTDATISRYENDRTPVPTSVLYAYQALCNVPMEWLRGEVELTQETVSSRWPGERPLFELMAAV